jgi:hypothetical protein
MQIDKRIRCTFCGGWHDLVPSLRKLVGRYGLIVGSGDKIYFGDEARAFVKANWLQSVKVANGNIVK